MTIAPMLKRIRAAWRARFNPEPPARLDGIVIQWRTTAACYLRREKWNVQEWHRQHAIRGEENRQRKLAWVQGERVK